MKKIYQAPILTITELTSIQMLAASTPDVRISSDEADYEQEALTKQNLWGHEWKGVWDED